MVISIGVDRKITFWDYNEDTILYSFSINCLGGKVDLIVENEAEKQFTVLVCRDNTIRIWDLSKKKNHFETLTLWKGLQNKVISHASMDPSDEGMIALAIGDNELTLYDLYTHSPVMTFEKEKLAAKFMKWIPKGFMITLYNEQVAKMVSGTTKETSQFECIFTKYSRNFKKIISSEYILLVVSDNYGLLFVDFSKEAIIKMTTKSAQFNSFDIICKSTGAMRNSLIVHGNKNGAVEFCYCDSELKSGNQNMPKAHTGSVSCLQFSRMFDGKLKCASGSYDRYINLYKIVNFGTKDFDPSKDISIFAKLKITQVNFSYHNYDQLLNVCDKHATVQIWDSSFEEKSERRLNNIRGHRGFVSSAAFSMQSPNTVISGSDDQTVKVWNLSEIKNTKPPNKKKPRPNKQDSEEEGEGEEEELEVVEEGGAPEEYAGFKEEELLEERGEEDDGDYEYVPKTAAKGPTN